MDEHPDSHFLLQGMGPYAETFKSIFGREGMLDRLHHPEGYLSGQTLADAYHAMDVFGFASKSETQGMVLAEAMTAGVPVIAIDAPGPREVVRDGENGRLIMEEDQHSFRKPCWLLSTAMKPRRQALKTELCQPLKISP
ncbi:MAG: glycosyltransferase [Pirellulaceae bacterium]